jgi:hypothetical protein
MKGSPFHERYPDPFDRRAWLLKGWMKALTEGQLFNLLEWNLGRLRTSRPGSCQNYSATQAIIAIENERRRRGRRLKRGE